MDLWCHGKSDYHNDGIPPIRHMSLEDGYTARVDVIAGQVDEQNPYAQSKKMEVSEKYMFGPSILVAPLDKIPLYVKNGGIVPLMPAVNNVRLSTGPVALEVRHYGTKEGSYRLYDDDGVTYDFERGVSSRQELRAVRSGPIMKGTVEAATRPWMDRGMGMAQRRDIGPFGLPKLSSPCRISLTYAPHRSPLWMTCIMGAFFYAPHLVSNPWERR